METEKTNGQVAKADVIDRAMELGEPTARSAPMPAEFCSPSIMKLALALAKAQGAFRVIERTREVTVTTKDKEGRPNGSYTFKYAPLDVVLSATLPALNSNGLSLVSLPMLGGDVLRTLLLHESGEFLAVEVRMPSYDSPQKFGSALTYLRRYSVVSLLGVASEEDDDGNAASGNTIEKKTDRLPTPPPRKRPWMEKLQAAVGKLNLGEQKAAGLKGKAKDDVIRDERIAYLCWCAGRRVVSTLDLTDEEADLVIRRAELGEVPQ